MYLVAEETVALRASKISRRCSSTTRWKEGVVLEVEGHVGTLRKFWVTCVFLELTRERQTANLLNERGLRLGNRLRQSGPEACKDLG